MIVLDTMVVLEPFKKGADLHVIEWLDGQDSGELWLTTISVAELQTGVEMEMAPEVRAKMQGEVSVILEQFAGRFLPFDLKAAFFYAEIAAPRERAERRVSALDFHNAAIARAHGAAVATRNAHHFADCGVELVDPWTA